MSLKLDVVTRLAGSACVECGKHLDATSGPCAPTPGDFTLCIECGSLNVFDEALGLRRPTDDEMFAAAKDPHVQRVRRAIREVRGRSGPMTAPTSVRGNRTA